MSNIPERTLKSPKLNKISIKQIHKSPQLKNVLRQKWQQRMKEKRNASFNWQRFRPDEEYQSAMNHFYECITEIMEFPDYDNEIKLEADWEEWFEKKYAEEEERSTLLEYDDMQLFEELLDVMAASNQDLNYTEAICPMCQKNIMTEECENIVCSNCKFVLPAKMSLADFSNSINSKSAMHSSNCDSCPTFITIPENDTISLYLTCDTCSCCLLIM